MPVTTWGNYRGRKHPTCYPLPCPPPHTLPNYEGVVALNLTPPPPTLIMSEPTEGTERTWSLVWVQLVNTYWVVTSLRFQRLTTRHCTKMKATEGDVGRIDTPCVGGLDHRETVCWMSRVLRCTCMKCQMCMKHSKRDEKRLDTRYLSSHPGQVVHRCLSETGMDILIGHIPARNEPPSFPLSQSPAPICDPIFTPLHFQL